MLLIHLTAEEGSSLDMISFSVPGQMDSNQSQPHS
jgi:hypothetical protein